MLKIHKKFNKETGKAYFSINDRNQATIKDVIEALKFLLVPHSYESIDLIAESISKDAEFLIKFLRQGNIKIRFVYLHNARYIPNCKERYYYSDESEPPNIPGALAEYSNWDWRTEIPKGASRLPF